MSNLEAQIRSQPAALERMVTSQTVRQQVHAAAEGLHRARRIWIVGTGTSLHASALGAAMIREAGRSAQAFSSMQFVHHAPNVGRQDAIVIITHTAETSYALAARALAFQAGLDIVTITRTGTALNPAIETVSKETSETYTVSYTTALVALAMLAQELGAEGITDEALGRIPGSVAAAIAEPGIRAVPTPDRLLVLAGVGPGAWTAREGALKVREAARFLAEGYDAEYLLHGSAVPLGAGDRLVLLKPPDGDGFLPALGAAASGAGVAVSTLVETADLPPVLAQIPLTARLQLLALRIAVERGQDPDTVIVGSWADPALWAMGAPGPTPAPPVAP
jgi:glucosamine--fructose-6-phosphate aminotransferase (isomerizing)